MILVLLGVGIVLIVVLFNWWQEKKYRRDVEYRFGQTRGDMLDTGGQSPTLKSATDKKPLSEDMEGWMSEPRVRGVVDHADIKPTVTKIEPSFKLAEPKISAGLKTAELPLNETSKPSAINQHALDFTQSAYKVEAVVQPKVDADIEPLVLPTASPIDANANISANVEEAASDSGAQLPVALPSALHIAMDWVGVIDAPLGVMLAELDEMQAEIRTFPQHTALWVQTEGADWQDLLTMDKAAVQSHPPAQRLACAIQLADRGGPVGNETLKRFEQSMVTLSRSLGLQVFWQGACAPEQQAQHIDAFAIEVDKAVEFHLMATQGAFHATKLRGLAEASGMHVSVQGRFELVNSSGQLEFTLRNYEGKPFSAEMLKTAVMSGVTFQLDIPTTPNSVQVFDHMVEVARTMAHSLNAVMTDVNRKPLGEPQLEKIRHQLKTISATMAAQGILPGSSHALRLFS